MTIALQPAPRFTLPSLRKFLINPLFLLIMGLLGIWIGSTSPSLTRIITPFGNLYIELLRMVLLPFLICAIMVSIAKLFNFASVRTQVLQVVLVFFMTTTLTAMVGVISMTALNPGHSVNESSRKSLGEILNTNAYATDFEISLDQPHGKPKDDDTALEIVQSFVPGNIFNALSVGETVKILFFAIIFGASLGQLRISQRGALEDTLVSVYTMCTRIIDAVNMLLPFALCAMLAKQVADVGLDRLLAMVNFLIAFGLIAASAVWLSIGVVAYRANVSFMRAAMAMRAPLLVAISTRSSIACVPSSIAALSDDLDFSHEKTQLLLPLGMTFCRVGPILYYAVATMFIAQLHDITFTPTIFVAVVLGAWVAGLASAGTTGVLTISLLSLVFEPIGLPLDAALVLFVAVDPIADIFRTAAIVLPNCATTALLAERESEMVKSA